MVSTLERFLLHFFFKETIKSNDQRHIVGTLKRDDDPLFHPSSFTTFENFIRICSSIITHLQYTNVKQFKML